jgi:dTDP-4-amino-4,6-dideoxygalactose transaminase
MRIPFVDLKSQFEGIQSEVVSAVNDVLQSASFVGGEQVGRFEREFATYCGTKHAVGVANGTDALELALRALGIGQGDEVITTANTFIATAAAIARSGATPVFVDVDPVTYTINPNLIEHAVTRHTKAIIPVHLYGQPAEMRPIMALAADCGISVIEDAAQAHGAEYEGRRVGSIGHLACFSFYPGKNLGAYGDGGAVTTNDDRHAERIARLRNHGRITKYEHAEVGRNSRLDTLQAAVLLVKLRHLDDWNRQRQKVARWYERALARTPYTLPKLGPNRTHVFHLFVILAEDRDAVARQLQDAGIASGIHYPLPLHLQPALAHLGCKKGMLPITEAAATQALSLPMFPELTYEQVFAVAAVMVKGAQLAEPSVVCR